MASTVVQSKVSRYVDMSLNLRLFSNVTSNRGFFFPHIRSLPTLWKPMWSSWLKQTLASRIITGMHITGLGKTYQSWRMGDWSGLVSSNAAISFKNKKTSHTTFTTLSPMRSHYQSLTGRFGELTCRRSCFRVFMYEQKLRDIHFHSFIFSFQREPRIALPLSTLPNMFPKPTIPLHIWSCHEYCMRCKFSFADIWLNCA